MGVVDGFACVRYISYDSKRTVLYGDAFISLIRVARSRGQASFSNFGATGTTNSQSLRAALTFRSSFETWTATTPHWSVVARDVARSQTPCRVSTKHENL